MFARVLSELRQDLPLAARYLRATTGNLMRWLARARADILIAAALALVAGLGCFALARAVPPELVDPQLDAWVWFESDLIRVFQIMISRGADNYRTNVHPLQALIMYVPTKTMVKLGLAEATAVLTFLSIAAGLWAAALFATLRNLTLPRLDAVIFTALGASTSAAVFWFTVPEIHSVGGLTLMLAFLLGSIFMRKATPAIVPAIASALSFSATTTNWMAGMIMSIATYNYKKAFRVTLDALVIVTILFGVQKLITPSAQFFVPYVHAEAAFLFHELSGSLTDKLRAFFIFSVAVPTIPFLDHPVFPDWVRLSIQFTPFSALGVLAKMAGVLWLGLVAVGLVTGLRRADTRLMVTALGLFVAFEFLLHLVYGDETFLYSLNFVPPMVIIAACASFSKYRPAVLAAAVLFTLSAGYNNVTEFIRVNNDLAAHAADLLERKPDIRTTGATRINP